MHLSQKLCGLRNRSNKMENHGLLRIILELVKVKDKTYKKLIKEEDGTKKENLMYTYKQQKNEITKLL